MRQDLPLLRAPTWQTANAIFLVAVLAGAVTTYRGFPLSVRALGVAMLIAVALLLAAALRGIYALVARRPFASPWVVIVAAGLLAPVAIGASSRPGLCDPEAAALTRALDRAAPSSRPAEVPALEKLLARVEGVRISRRLTFEGDDAASVVVVTTDGSVDAEEVLEDAAKAIAPIAPPTLREGVAFRDRDFLIMGAPQPCSAAAVLATYEQRAYEVYAELEEAR